jgi:hypothetical protein
MSRKGVASARVRTPHGDLLVANTHMQSSYLTGDYAPVRLGQALELTNALAGDEGGPTSFLPAILAGDLNATPGDVEFQVVEAGAGLAPAADSFDIDAVLYRSGADVVLRPLGARRVLVDPVDLGDGTRMPLSDHAGVLVEFQLERAAETSPASPAAPPPRRRWADVSPRAAALVRAAMSSSLSTRRWAAAGATALVVLAAGFVVARRRRPAHRVPWRALCALALLVSGYVAYLALVYAPDRMAGLEHAARMLSMRERPAAAQLATGSAQ